MFNYFGDCNGRHNIPEVPMLDLLISLLFGLGLIWTLTHPGRKHSAWILLWFVSALFPGFLTIEAPQGIRCIGAIIPVILLAGTGLEHVWQSILRVTCGTPLRYLAGGGLLALILLIGFRNARDYFIHQAGNKTCWMAFSAPEAAMGNEIRKLGPNYYTYVSNGLYDYDYLFTSISFLGYPNIEAERFLSATAIPSQYQGEKNLAYFLLPHHEKAIELLRYYYPRGREERHVSPYGDKLFTSYLVSREEVIASQGLSGCYRDANGGIWEDHDGREIQYPVVVDRSGSIIIPAWDYYAFRISGLRNTSMRVNGRNAREKEIQLVQGVHAIEIKGELYSKPQSIALFWKKGREGQWENIPAGAFRTQKQVYGLTGSYWRSFLWNRGSQIRRIDPFTTLICNDFPMKAPFSARWEGRIKIPRKGRYAFGSVSNELSWIYIDNKLLVENLVRDNYKEAKVYLTQGYHEIRIDYQMKHGDFPRIILFWTPPGEPKSEIPSRVLSPDL